MKIRILKNTVCGGKRVKADDEVSASEQDARLLISLGKAEKASAKAAPKQSGQPK